MSIRFTQLVFEGVADGSAGVTLDILGAALRIIRAAPPELDVSAKALGLRVLSLDGTPVRTAAGRALQVDGALNVRGLGTNDVLIVPGLGMATADEIDAALARDDLSAGAGALAHARRRGATVAGSCSATFLLGASGILDGHEATTTWWLGPVFAQRFPKVRLRDDRMVVADGRLMTAGAAFAHADLVLALLAHKVSPSLAHLVARYLLLDERTSQARYMIQEHIRTNDPLILALERFLMRHIERQVSIAEMARATATSPRTLARRVASALGTTPLHFAQKLRIARAQHLLETTRLSVEEVAQSVGYADAAAFRRVFRRELGQAPGSARSARP